MVEIKDLYRLAPGDYILRVERALVQPETIQRLVKVFTALAMRKIRVYMVYAPKDALEFIPTVKRKAKK